SPVPREPVTFAKAKQLIRLAAVEALEQKLKRDGEEVVRLGWPAPGGRPLPLSASWARPASSSCSETRLPSFSISCLEFW
ncbi:hypothetical protein BHM03_00012097, partial [Ensete ventricosum]